MILSTVLFATLLGVIANNKYQQDKAKKLLEDTENRNDKVTTETITNHQGLKISETTYYSDVTYSKMYERNDNGKIVAVKTTISNLNNGNASTTADFYDIDGNLTNENVLIQKSKEVKFWGN